MESAAILDVLLNLELLSKISVEEGKAILNEVVGILTSICVKRAERWG